MENNKDKNINLSPEMFKRTKVDISEAEKMSVESLSFWQDAFRRLMGNKGAIISLVIIAILIIMSIIGPIKPINRTNYDGTVLTYDSSPVVLGKDGKILDKEDIFFLPPRIPGLEKLGIFDGTAKAEIPSFDLIVGDIPRNDEFNDLRKPQNKKKLVEKLGIPYHPFEINITNIYEKDGVLLMDYTVIKSGEEKTTKYVDMISKYSLYQPGSFKFVSTELDDFGANMLIVKKNYYKMQDVDHLYFWFGTDKSPFDNWTRLWIGVRVSLLIALAALLIDFSIGIAYGTITGFYAGTWIDNVMMRFTEVLGSIPFIVFLFIMISIKPVINAFIQNLVYSFASGKALIYITVIFFVIFTINQLIKLYRKQISKKELMMHYKNPVITFVVLGVIQAAITFFLKSNGMLSVKMATTEVISFLIIVFAMSLTGWIGVTRIVRAQIIKLRDQEFILAARTLGADNSRIMKKHLFPNIIGQLVVLATFKIPSAIFTEAFLTFIGLGLPIPMASLGVLVFRGYEAMELQPSLLFIPAFVMSILMLAVNLLANGLRDALDPRMR